MTELKISPPPFPNREEYPFVASVRYRGMVIDIENLDGSVREGTDPNGRTWRTPFKGCHYGELRNSLGSDGDPLDVYIKSNPNDGANKAYIVHQNHPRTHPTKGGQYDEDKVVLGVSSADEAKELYLQHYNRKDFFRSITEMGIEPFKRYALGENKGEKVAAKAKKLCKRPASAFIRMKMREGGNTMSHKDKVKEAAEKVSACKTPGKKIKSKGKGQGKAYGKGKGPKGIPVGMKKKSAIDDAYVAGVKTALADYLKNAAITNPTPKGFMTVLKKPVGAPAVKGKIPPPPKVKTM